MFFMAVLHLFDVDYRHMTEENLKRTVEEMEKEDDKGAFITKGFKIQLLETALKIRQVAATRALAQFVSRA